MSPIVLIPARLAATRLPDKPLADIHGLPMIVHVLRRAQEADVGPVAVATDTPEIAEAVRAAGGLAVLTRSDHPSGSDRIHEALGLLDPEGRHPLVLNVQGDLPTIDPAAIRAAAALMADPAVDLGTLVAEIVRDEEREGPLYHHIGLYAWRRAALARFVALPPSALERREKLEQLRALEAGMRIDAQEVAVVPLGVDTPADLDRARSLLAPGARP
jgi:3-deoxy-manno-octulosonate cytidylyltransferase (CMP-KDO synthetase)